jgi:hypothetical protein
MGKIYIHGNRHTAPALGISFSDDQAVHVFGWMSDEPGDYFSVRLTPDEAERCARELADRAQRVREFLELP